MFFGFFILFLVQLKSVHSVQCSDNTACMCLPGYINCRGVITLPDVLDSRIFPLRGTPPVTADLRGNALSRDTLTRFLLVFGSLERLVLTDQLEEQCDDIYQLRKQFPHVQIESDCPVRNIFKCCHCSDTDV